MTSWRVHWFLAALYFFASLENSHNFCKLILRLPWIFRTLPEALPAKWKPMDEKFFHSIEQQLSWQLDWVSFLCHSPCSFLLWLSASWRLLYAKAINLTFIFHLFRNSSRCGICIKSRRQRNEDQQLTHSFRACCYLIWLWYVCRINSLAHFTAETWHSAAHEQSVSRALYLHRKGVASFLCPSRVSRSLLSVFVAFHFWNPLHF